MKILKLIFGMLLFATPIIYVTNTNELYEFPKMFFVYILGSTAFLFFCGIKILNQQKLQLPSKPTSVFMLIYLVSTLFSMHMYTSVWGYYTRFNGGLMSMLIFFGLYIIARDSLSKYFLKQLFMFATLTLMPIGLYSAMQHFSFLQVFWGHEPAVRVYSTFGQPNWLAAYVIALLPFALFFYSKVTDTKKTMLWLVVSLLGFSSLWFSYSMSGLLAFVCAFIVFIIFNKEAFKKSIIFIIFAFIIAITNLGVFQAKIHDVFQDVQKKITYATRVYAQTDNALSDPGFIRLGLWEGTVHLITSNPKIILIGTGPETFPYAFQSFRPRSLNYSSEWDFVFNKPHNYYLELASNIGIFGLISYLVILVRLIKTKHRVLVPSVVAMAVTNLFGWPTVALNLLFWLYIAYLEKK